MATALVALATTTLTASSATITFSSISSGFRDLRLVVERFSTVNANMSARLNGDTGTNYNNVIAYGNGSTASSISHINSTILTVEQNVFSTTTETVQTYFDFLDYGQSDKQKTVLIRTNRAAQGTEMNAGRWASTAAITSITLSCGNFAAGTTATLYGVSA